MTEQDAKALAAEFNHNRYWFVYQCAPMPHITSHWYVSIVRRDLCDNLILTHGDAGDLADVREHTKPLLDS